MVQVMNLQIEDSEHILSRVTKNNLNQDIFSQIREGWTPALGSRGPCTPMQLPWSQPDPLASEPGSTQGQGLAGGHSGATLGPSSPKSCPRTLPSLVGVQWLALTTPCTREGGALHQCPVPSLAGPPLSSTSGGLGPSPAADAVWSWPSPLPSLDLSFLILKMEFGSFPCLLEGLWGQQPWGSCGVPPTPGRGSDSLVEEERGGRSAKPDPEPSFGV